MNARTPRLIVKLEKDYTSRENGILQEAGVAQSSLERS